MPASRAVWPLGQRWRRRDCLFLGLLLVITYSFSAAWSFHVPLPPTTGGNSLFPDELSHASVARYLAEQGTLPPYQFPFDTSVHPPLYHFLAAIILALFRPLGNQGALLAVRLATGFCGVGVVYLTYQAARHFGSRRFALTAAALVALIPTRVLIGGGITNENLAALGAAGTLAILVGGLRRREGFTVRALSLLALYLVIGIGSKLTCLGLLPAAMAAVLWKRRQQGKPWLVALRPVLVLPGAVAAAWGWWFVRNQRLYGDPFRKAAADRLWNELQPGYAYRHLNQGTTPLLYTRALLHSGWESFWGNFNGAGLPLPVYFTLALFQIAVIFGLLRLLMRSGGGIAYRRILLSSRWAAGAIALFYTASVFAIYLAYNWSHYTPQGRYFFVLLLPFGIVTALGWRAGLRSLPAPWRELPTPFLLLLMGLLNLYCLLVMPQ